MLLTPTDLVLLSFFAFFDAIHTGFDSIFSGSSESDLICLTLGLYGFIY